MNEEGKQESRTKTFFPSFYYSMFFFVYSRFFSYSISSFVLFLFFISSKKTYVKNGNPVYISLSFFLIFFFQTIRSENYQRSFATFTYLNNNKKRRRRRRRKRNDRM